MKKCLKKKLSSKKKLTIKKKLTVELTLSKSQLNLLKKLKKGEEGFDDWACDHSEEEEEDMVELIEKGLAESILGELFYITKLGEKFLKNEAIRS